MDSSPINLPTNNQKVWYDNRIRFGRKNMIAEHSKMFLFREEPA